MSAEILSFPVRPPAPPPVSPPRLEPGDMVVACVNATLKVWCAWPVAVVDDDGVMIGVHSAGGRMLGVDRLNCDPTVYGFRAGDHEAAGFAGLRWKTWRDPGDALLAFARIGLTGRDGAVRDEAGAP